ncbi:transcriptional regulator [Corynebacterium sp.]|uniref:helix-turn-helix transcriptional regulator n=1 Tax=Corynebacterium sp. TaxID=1720 RepID=UPI0026DAFFC4|nr:PAS domain-containing protein [Corynebacterium sp.]MDO5033102.1 PAS domain-containing protein [Corynebacterium sp.]
MRKRLNNVIERHAPQCNPTVRPYIPLVEFLGAAIGPNCELVLHDLDDPECSIVAIANGHISGRVVGGPVTNFALWFMRQAEKNHVPSLTGYKSVNSEGRACRSSSYFIRDEDGRLRGMLCINADVTELVNIEDALRRFMGEDISSMPDKIDAFPPERADSVVESRPTFEDAPAEAEAVEVLGGSLNELLDNMLTGVLSKTDVPVDRMKSKERIEVVSQLEQDGFFLLKGGIAAAAERLGVSEPTVYRYLAQVRS